MLKSLTQLLQWKITEKISKEKNKSKLKLKIILNSRKTPFQRKISAKKQKHNYLLEQKVFQISVLSLLFSIPQSLFFFSYHCFILLSNSLLSLFILLHSPHTISSSHLPTFPLKIIFFSFKFSLSLKSNYFFISIHNKNLSCCYPLSLHIMILHYANHHYLIIFHS